MIDGKHKYQSIDKETHPLPKPRGKPLACESRKQKRQNPGLLAFLRQPQPLQLSSIQAKLTNQATTPIPRLHAHPSRSRAAARSLSSLGFPLPWRSPSPRTPRSPPWPLRARSSSASPSRPYGAGSAPTAGPTRPGWSSARCSAPTPSSCTPTTPARFMSWRPDLGCHPFLLRFPRPPEFVARRINLWVSCGDGWVLVPMAGPREGRG